MIYRLLWAIWGLPYDGWLRLVRVSRRAGLWLGLRKPVGSRVLYRKLERRHVKLVMDIDEQLLLYWLAFGLDFREAARQLGFMQPVHYSIAVMSLIKDLEGVCRDNGLFGNWLYPGESLQHHILAPILSELE